MKRHFFLDYAERLFFKAQKALTARDFERAEDLLQQAIATDPEYPHLHMYLGIALGELDRPTEAVSALRKAIELDPKNFVFHMALGIRFLDDGDAAEARRHFQEAARRAPDNLLVKSYVRLASWELGELGVDGLLHDLRDVPIAFRARLLVSLQERAISKAGPAQVLMEGAFDERASETPVRWPWLMRWFDAERFAWPSSSSRARNTRGRSRFCCRCPMG